MEKTACHQCGVIIEDFEVNDLDHQYYCPRCEALIYRPGQAFSYIVAMALSALILFLPAVSLPILTLNIAGIEQSTTLVEAVLAFFGDGYGFIAFMVLLTGIVIPFVMIVLILAILIPIHFGAPPKRVATLFRLYEHLSEWGMGEVYLISILVAIIKLQKMANLVIGLGFYLFIGFLLTMFISFIWFNPHDIWHIQKEKN